MSSRKRFNLVLILGAIALLIVFVAILQGQTGNAYKGVPPVRAIGTVVVQGPPSDYEVVRSQDYGNWSYAATRSDKYFEPLHATVNYDHDTVEDLLAYRDMNKGLLPYIASLGGRVEVAVTFVYHVDGPWFVEWANKNGFEVSSSQMAGTYNFGGKPGEPLSLEGLSNFGFTVDKVAVFGTWGTVDASRLDDLLAEPKIFLVDVTPAWVRHDLAVAGVSEPLKEPAHVDSPFGYMERFGLEKFTSLPMPTLPPEVATYQPRVTTTPEGP